MFLRAAKFTKHIKGNVYWYDQENITEIYGIYGICKEVKKLWFLLNLLMSLFISFFPSSDFSPPYEYL